MFLELTLLQKKPSQSDVAWQKVNWLLATLRFGVFENASMINNTLHNALKCILFINAFCQSRENHRGVLMYTSSHFNIRFLCLHLQISTGLKHTINSIKLLIYDTTKAYWKYNKQKNSFLNITLWYLGGQFCFCMHII